MKKFYCDRCGKEIKGDPLRLMSSFSYTSDPSEDISMDIKKRVTRLMRPLEEKDFCIDCIEEIVEFALNGNTCDECVQQMMEENAMLREEDEKAGSGSSEPDPGQFPAGADKDGEGRPRIQYAASTEELAEVMRSMRRDFQCRSGQS